MHNSPARKVGRSLTVAWQKSRATWLVIFLLASGVVAQVTGFVSYWPVLYEMSENLVVKRGVDDQGNPNDLMFFRIGWGPCLALGIDEWQTLIDASFTDRFMNMRDYADSVFVAATEIDNFSANCPKPPMSLKDTWRGSRPTYLWEYDPDSGNWIRGKKSPYRIRTDVLVDCLPYNARKTDGSSTNYWRLDNSAVVYDSSGEYTIEFLNFIDPPYGLLSVCEETKSSIENYRW